MQREFTGKHMLAVLVGGFGIVMAVNFTMATYAVSGFNGVVVENSYVASQKFNGWLDESRKQQSLGWQADLARSETGQLIVRTDGVPEGAAVTAMIRRPLGEADVTDIALIHTASAQYESTSGIPSGRWIVRLKIEANGQSWSQEGEIA